jgi:release factor glutamine methyltransferase
VTVADVLADATARLRAAGVSNPELDAELLLRHVTGWDRATLLARPETEVSSQGRSHFRSLVEERARRRPLQHLTGVQAFWRHEFLVTPDVLIPRPETEVLVEASLALLRVRPQSVVADVGTGSGCIALSLAAEAGEAQVHAIEVSPSALTVARQNAERLGLAEHVRFHEGDLLEPLARLEGRLDLVVSNPPYVDAADAPSLAPEVRYHEPAIALFPPGEPLAIVKRLLTQAARLLRPGGHLIVEVGQGQSEAVAHLGAAAGLEVEHVLYDLSRIPRAIVARRPIILPR